MAINIKTPSIHHIALKVSDYDRAKKFYLDTLGFPLVAEFEKLFLFYAGSTVIGISPALEKGEFNPHTVGMNHIALTCSDEAELERVAKGLKEENIENTGVKMDETLGKKYIAFKDPDRIAWEFFSV